MLIITGVGINKTISISKTIKIMANKKNRMENGVRAEWFGSKPHSNGDNFSRSFWDRIDKISAIINIRIGRIIEIINTENRIFIYLHFIISYD